MKLHFYITILTVLALKLFEIIIIYRLNFLLLYRIYPIYIDAAADAAALTLYNQKVGKLIEYSI